MAIVCQSPSKCDCKVSDRNMVTFISIMFCFLVLFLGQIINVARDSVWKKFYKNLNFREAI